jgi:hypothetical protein
LDGKQQVKNTMQQVSMVLLWKNSGRIYGTVYADNLSALHAAIISVVGDVRRFIFDPGWKPAIYLPQAQSAAPDASGGAHFRQAV